MRHLYFSVVVFIVLFSSSNNSKGSVYIDSLKTVLSFYEKENLTDSILNTRLELIKYVRYSDFELFLELINKNLELAEEQGQHWAQIDALMELGEIFIQKGFFDKAIENLNEALELAQVDEYRPYVGWVCISIGNAYEGLFSYSKAIDYYEMAYQVFEQEQETEGMALSTTNIGNCFQELGELDKADSYYLKALSMRDPDSDFINYGYILMYQAEVNKMRNNCEKAQRALINLESDIKNYLGQSENPNDIIEGNNLLSYVYWFISDCQADLGNSQNAINFLKKSVVVNKEINNNLGLATLYNLIGNLYLNAHDHKNAQLFADSALNVALNENTYVELANSYLLLSEIYSYLDQQENALKYYKEYKSVNDSMFNNSVVHAIADVDVLVKTVESEKNNQILLLRINQKQKLVLLTSVGGGIIVALITIVILILYRRFKKEKRLSNLLVSKNKEISEKNVNLKNLNKELHTLNISKDKFNSIIAHDLKNPAATVYSLIDLLKGSYDEYPESSRKELIDMAHDMAERNVNLLEKLLTWSRIQDGRMELNPTSFSIADVLKDCLELSKSMAEAKGVLIRMSKVEDVEIEGDIDMITTVIRNLYSNAIKFTFPGKKIESGIRKLENQVEVWIKDEGIGIPEDKIKTLFNIDSELQRKGTNEESGTGLGLQLCNEFIKLHKGTFSVESSEGKGSRFAFYLPA